MNNAQLLSALQVNRIMPCRFPHPTGAFLHTRLDGVHDAGIPQVIRGGTGYGPGPDLPDEVEHIYPDYSIYPQFPDTAYGFLTRGCPRSCPFASYRGRRGGTAWAVGRS